MKRDPAMGNFSLLVSAPSSYEILMIVVLRLSGSCTTLHFGMGVWGRGGKLM